jgi:hypothetical protein
VSGTRAASPRRAANWVPLDDAVAIAIARSEQAFQRTAAEEGR